MNTKLRILLGILIVFTACNNSENISDAYGNFEAIETIISAEASGKLIMSKLEEGQHYNKNEIVAIIDTVQISLQLKQLQAQKEAVKTKISVFNAQKSIFKEQLNTLLIEKKRLENLIKAGAATSQKMDDIEGKERVLKSQIKSVDTQTQSVSKELKVIDIQQQQVQDKINRCYIKNPFLGTILEKYVEENELIMQGKSLYKISDISKLELRAYVSGSQLSAIKIGQKITVLIDGSNEELIPYEGTISWISASSEFTPKIIQTRDERVNLVYAIKILVNNDGLLKIGMPAEVKF